MKLTDIFEAEGRDRRLVVVYGGRFQPFHRGHYHVYLWLCKKFDKENVWLATSDKVNFKEKEGDISPFTFKEKQEIITSLYGIEPRRVVKCKNPTFKPVEIFEQYRGYTPVYLAAVGKKDLERYSNARTFDELPDDHDLSRLLTVKDHHGYYVAVPMKSEGISGTQVREALLAAEDDEPAMKKLFMKYFGRYDPVITDLIIAKLKFQS